MHGGSGSDDEGPKVEEEEEKPNGGQGCLREERPRERESGSGGLSFGSWAHRPLESEIASDRN